MKKAVGSKRCRTLRETATKAENLLWSHLRNRRLLGFKFRRQHPVDKYVVDFYCHEARLVVEVDGGQHGREDQSGMASQRKSEQDGMASQRESEQDGMASQRKSEQDGMASQRKSEQDGMASQRERE